VIPVRADPEIQTEGAKSHDATAKSSHSLYTRLVAGILFPLHERLKGHETVKVLGELEESQWLSPAALREHQSAKLRRFVDRIHREVPYYRRVFQERGLAPGDVRHAADLRMLPFLTKDLIRAHSDELKAGGAPDLSRYNTGGSSGEPLVFWIGKERVTHDVAAKWRATRWWGVDIGDPEVVVWGSPVEVDAQDRVRALRDRVLRTTLLPAFEMSESNLDRFVADIRRLRPRMLFGYPSSLSLIARHAEGRGVGLDNLGIAVAFVTSERLYDHQAEDIRRVFGCPVANGYGGRDAGFIAHQCPAGGMHVTAEDIVLEVIGEDGEPVVPGRSGELVVTHLGTAHFPFVRYRTGDVGRMSDAACPCGRGLPLLEEIEGRSTDFIVAPDGTLMHGLALIYVVRDLPDVRSFKITQSGRTTFDVQIVPEEDFSNWHRARIETGFAARLGSDISLTIRCVDEIPSERSGKFRYVVNEYLARDSAHVSRSSDQGEAHQ
jgi:phenylacetate-CoA ligase